MGKNFNLGLVSLLVFTLIFSAIVSLSFVSAGFSDCYLYDGINGGTNTTCIDAGCKWTTNATDTWCFDSVGCCLPNGCWRYDGNQSACTNSSLNGGLSCTWDPYAVDMWKNITGMCFDDFAIGGEWGGMADGCWSNDGDKASCISNNMCNWVPNDANQNPWCFISTLSDAQTENPSATSADIGCCEQKGCWNYDGNQTQCEASTTFNGLCVYDGLGGWCNPKWCSDITDATNCSYAATTLYMPCSWNNGSFVCEDSFGGGFMYYNDTDSCMMQGGWWNGTDCEMPSGGFGGGGGGFMFAEEAHCWFADNQPTICNNLTGCAYCVSGTGANGVSNSSSNNICAGKPVGLCEGHDVWSSDIYANANNSVNLNCTHIQIKSACNFGPLPNCVWSNSSTTSGQYCNPGTSSSKKSAPPVGFCEHPDAVNNYTLCNQLATVYMMPCKWGNASSNQSFSDNCTFNSNAVFGFGNAKEFETVTSEMSCVAAGGTWQTEYYVEGTTLKQDSWCEKGASFNLATGQAAANKGNCDKDCWACEFNNSGGNFGGNATMAQQNCEGSALGYCRWVTDTNAPNSLGWCDYPKEMSYGAGDCQTNCKDCNLMQNAYDACTNSLADCKWINDTNSVGATLATGDCVKKSKKVCDSDCFSCYDFTSCNASSTNCQWDGVNYLCKPASDEKMEICFDGNDNDGDMLVDCSDPDCSFDTSCGGSSFGDCAKYTDAATCNDASAFGNQNCTWINFTWEPVGHCGMPGENCFLWDGNMSGCGQQTGCSNQSTGGSNFCDVNETRQTEANCWQYSDNDTVTGCEGSSGGGSNCKWVVPEWGQPFCDYWIFSQCMDYGTNETACRSDGNCTWSSEWGEPHCDIGCFDHTLNSSDCISGNRSGGICEWRDASSDICVPQTFQLMGGSSGARSGCAQYDGNETACTANNFTCIWFDDSSVGNNVSSTETSGWCNSKGEYEMCGELKGEPTILGIDGPESSIDDYVDIQGFGMKVTDKAYGLGIRVVNISDSALCNSYPLFFELGGGIGRGIKTTKFYWYLDTDNNVTGSCSGYNENQDSIPGFEFYISYLVRNNTNTGNIDTTKQLFRCIQNPSGDWIWVVTNVYITDNKKFTCFESGAAFISIEKELLENFDSFNITSPMRVFGVSANATYNRSVPLDSVGPSYYTPGTIDFKFVDCSDPDTKDSKCKFFQKFGFQVFEDCKNGVDDDANGLTDCDDPKCVFTPTCASGVAFNFSSGTNDNKAPAIVFSKVDKMADMAVVSFDTDEPANGSLAFYNQSSNCALGPDNVTLNDLGDVLFTYDDYKPFHRITLDSDSLGYGLINSTVYYYRVTVCDPFNNCGTSACLNFTTRKVNKNFIFRMDLPPGFTVDIPALNYTGNFTTTVGGNVYDVGIKTNSSVTRKINITINYSDLSLKFIGVDVYKPKSIDLEKSFIVDTTNEILGMNSSTKSWQSLVNDLGLGGEGDAIELHFPVAYDADNVLNWTKDDGTNGQDVNDYTTCSGDTSITKCKIPTSLGFSAYKLEVPESTTTSTTSSGGGGGGGAATTGKIYVVTTEQFTEGYTKSLSAGDKLRFTIEDVKHYVTLNSLTSATVTIEVSSTPQTATLSVGQEKKFEVTDDNYYDISVTLNSINSSATGAEFTIKSIHEEITEEIQAVTTPEVTGETTTQEEEEQKQVATTEEGKTTPIWTIIIILIVVVIVVVIWLIIKKKK